MNSKKWLNLLRRLRDGCIKPGADSLVVWCGATGACTGGGGACTIGGGGGVGGKPSTSTFIFSTNLELCGADDDDYFFFIKESFSQIWSMLSWVYFDQSILNIQKDCFNCFKEKRILSLYPF